MKSLRTLLAAAMATALAVALLAGPASAKTPKAPYTYFATIDCGSGPVEVGSWDDLWAPLVDVKTGKKYRPVAWDVAVGELVIREYKDGEPKKRAVDCSYSDGVATGTVTVRKA
jgi:hypothetical protein